MFAISGEYNAPAYSRLFQQHPEELANIMGNQI
jgi:hypothetical protein